MSGVKVTSQLVLYFDTNQKNSFSVISLTNGRHADIIAQKEMKIMNLQDYLDSKNITKYRLSQISGVPKTTIMDICSGKSSLQKCSARTVWQLALCEKYFRMERDD